MSTLRLILRGWARAPLFTATAILSIALGIGANTAIFSILDRPLLQTLPVKDPHELAFFYHPGPLQGSVSTDEGDQPSFSYPMFGDFRKGQTSFTGIAGASATSASIAYNSQALPGRAHLVSGNYFEVLGVRPAIGRLFTEDDDRAPGGHPVVVLSHSYWTSRFGADVSTLNQTMVVNAYPMTIVGVAQKGFLGERLGGAPDIFVPVTMKREMTPDWNAFNDRLYYWLPMFGRLKPGVTREQAQAGMNVLYRAQIEEDIKLLKQPGKDFLERFRAKKLILKPGQHGRGGLRQQSRTPVLLLMGMTLLVLAIACANVANLQLVRAAARAREVAVRLAMGASRLQLIRQLLAEACALALAGGILGIAVASGTLRVILAAIPVGAGTAGFLTTDLHGRVLLFCLGLSLVTGILFGLFPALQASKADVASTLKDQAGQTTSAGSANFFRKSLVTVQIALSLLLLVTAGLLSRTLLNLTRVDLGIQVDRLLTFSLSPKLNRYSDERVVQFYEQLTDRLSAIPGVKLVSAARVPAIAGSNSSTSITVEGFVPQGGGSSSSWVNEIGSDYFRTLGVALIAGREFTRADGLTAPKVAIVNEAFARHYLPNQNPLGRRMRRGSGGNTPLDTEIVGVVKDYKYSDIREAPRRVFYTPHPQSRRQGGLYFYVRTAIGPQNIAPLIRREVAALDPNLPIRDLKTMQKQIDENVFGERLLSSLTGAFAGLATLLAAIGLYGVLAYNVARRTREIGIRMALGADSGHVRGLVVREVALMLVIGTAAGLGSAAAAGTLIRTILYGLKSWDPFVYASAALFLALVAAGSAYLPARRATRVDPMVALRYE